MNNVRVDIVIPCFNEGPGLIPNGERLHDAVSQLLTDRDWRVVLASNGCDPSTRAAAAALSGKYERMDHLHVDRPGRGGALRRAWLQSEADVCVCMDADLPFGLEVLPLLVDAVAAGGCDIAVGSRFLPESQVRGRRLLRRITSRVYLLLLHAMFDVPARDAQCGVRAITRDAVDDLVPRVVNNNYFFDSELLIVAHRRGLRIQEVPVVCRDNSASTVRVLRTALEFLRGLARMKFAGCVESKSRRYRVSPPR